MLKEVWHKFSTCRSEKFAWEGYSDAGCQLHRWHRGDHLKVVALIGGLYSQKRTKKVVWERGSKKPDPKYPFVYRAPFDYEEIRKHPETMAMADLFGLVNDPNIEDHEKIKAVSILQDRNVKLSPRTLELYGV